MRKNLPSSEALLVAIRAKCMDCSGNQRREWVEHIVEYSDKHHIPVFMKESLRELMGGDFRQEFPWEI